MELEIIIQHFKVPAVCMQLPSRIAQVPFYQEFDFVAHPVVGGVSQSVDLGRSNNPNTTPTKDYENVQVVVYLHGVQRGCAEEGERGSTPTG